ncbi:hypothetical protein EHEL_060400 [Encephalitozoon hellem ATCC 50504]|uniref:WD40 domain-containing protein n=1 Tax=Encephalitozoon hellem TaxID=27973 RepID=A0A9Q9C3A0_ENCHE|nr:uncharacterized protein EHEL_060400 [Encephalitozoon hellem ATCC 50504]AFM98413.1 hypothetical protein EHEL_060400 [Encephalitozoon hellem ATCC 50504]UTX43336.1 WD40 domain-containing protein [Encephalitozoon hellem]WEL38798.1 WD40 domain-containing protein [Encephalitozoon hellem]|eukprot:XP_003887394.1 hypothetical protein EHEL_060400 [Encephalitozoon hellem ATCC 50504]
MNNQVLIIGLDQDRDSLSEITPDNSLFRDNLCIVQLKTSQQAGLLLRKLEGLPHVRAHSLKEFYSIISAEDREYVPLKKLEPKEFVDFQFSGREQFAVLNDGVLSLFEQKTKEFEEMRGFNDVSKCAVSNDGMFVCFFVGSIIEIRVGRSLEIFSKVKLNDEVTDVLFSPDNKFIVAFTKKETSVWDIFKNECIVKLQGVRGDVVFDEGCACFLGQRKSFSLSLGREVEFDQKLAEMKCIRHHNHQRVEFGGDKIQKIIYSKGEYKLSKTHANIEDIKFYFSENRCFALMTKNIQKKSVQFVESYGADGITLTQLGGCAEQIEVSDKMFAVVDSKQTLLLYSRDKFSFNMVKQIKKEDDLLIALYDDVCCVHDSDTGNIEFYDNGELRSAYSHPSCTSISWSHSGLYVASASIGDCSSGLVQMFNKNGRLLWKKVFNRLSLFMWRPFMHIPEEDKIKAIEQFEGSIADDLSGEEECTADVGELLSKWKSYLISRKQRVLSLK